jgi:putative MATE family efflux protein
VVLMRGHYMRRQIMQLAWPVILEMLGIMLVSVMTTVMVGRLGAIPLTAVGLATMVQFSTAMIFAAAGTGATAIVAREAGVGNIETLRTVAGQAVMLGFVLGTVLAIGGYNVAPYFFIAAGTEPDVAALAVDLLQIMFMFTPFYLVMAIGNAILRGVGRTRTAFLITTFANFWGLMVSYMLIFGVGVPAVGAYGAAWGTGLSQMIGGGLVTGVLVTSKGNVGLILRHFVNWDMLTIRRILKLSIPAAMEQFAMQGGRIVFTFLLAGVGATQFAGHQIAIQVESISFMPGFGFSVAAMTLIGQYLGKGLPHRAAQYAWLTNSIAFWSMAAMGTVFFFFAEPLAGLFIEDPAVIEWGALCVRVAALEQPTIALTYVFGGALRGAGDTRWPLYVTVIGVWLVRMPLVFLLIRFWHFNITAAWFITALDFLIRSIILWRRFALNKWQRICV